MLIHGTTLTLSLFEFRTTYKKSSKYINSYPNVTIHLTEIFELKI